MLIQIIDHLLSYCVDGIILNLIDLFKRFFWNRCFKFSNVKFDKFNLKFTREIFKPITYYCCVVPLINFSFARYIFNCFFHIIFANVTNFAFGVIDQSAFSVVSEVVLMIMSSIQKGGIETFCTLRYNLVWEYWNILPKIYKDLELYQVFMYNFYTKLIQNTLTHKSNTIFCPKISYINDTHFYNPPVKSVLFLFSHLLISKNSSIFWDATLLTSILHLSYFTCFTFFKFNMPSQKGVLIWLKIKTYCLKKSFSE